MKRMIVVALVGITLVCGCGSKAPSAQERRYEYQWSDGTTRYFFLTKEEMDMLEEGDADLDYHELPIAWDRTKSRAEGVLE